MRLLTITALLLALAVPALAVDGTTNFKIAATISRTLDLQTGTAPISWAMTDSWTDGTAANQFQVGWADERSTNSTGESLDLAGSLTDAFGRTLTFTAVKVLSVEASSSNTNTVKVGGGSNAFINWIANSSDIVEVRPGGCLIVAATDTTGYGVTADTGDILKVASGGTGSVTYKVVVLGEGTAP